MGVEEAIRAYRGHRARRALALVEAWLGDPSEAPGPGLETLEYMITATLNVIITHLDAMTFTRAPIAVDPTEDHDEPEDDENAN